MDISHEGNGKKRDALVDLARIVAIFVIIIGHTSIRTAPNPGCCAELNILHQLDGDVVNPVCFFFFFAGYFAKKTGRLFAWGRTGQLVLSTCLWSLVGYVVFHFLFSAEHYFHTHEFLAWKPLSLYQIVGDLASDVVPGHMDLWFMKVLIPIVFISSLLTRVPGWVLAILSLTCLWLGDYLETSAYDGMPYFLQQSSLSGMGCFSAGMLIRRFVSLPLLSAFVSKIALWYFVLMFIHSAVALVIPYHVFRVPVLGVFLEMLYFLSIAELVKRYMPGSQRLARYGTAVFFVYVMQEFLIVGANVLFTYFPINRHLYTLVPFVVLLLCLLLYEVAQRVLPTRIRKIVCLQS